MHVAVCDDEQGLVLKGKKGIVRISFEELEYVEVIDKMVSFHLANDIIYEVRATFGDVEEKLLSKPEFLKIHRAYLVNLTYIQEVDSDCVLTKSGHSIPIARQRHSQVKDAYLHFLIQEKEKLKSDVREEGLWRILLVDDEPDERTFWADVLRKHGCMVMLAESGRDALNLVEGKPCDCVLLDVMIPGEDGFSICEKLHKLVDAPVIFLSSVTESDKQLEGFAAGGIDYITKDTPAELFWAKVETRMKQEVSDRTRFSYGPLLVDLKKRRVQINEEELPLTAIEFDILWCLVKHMEHILSPEEILHMVWGSEYWGNEQIVQRNMSRLRKKLEKAWEKHHFIESVWGEGYRFVLPGE